MGEKWKSILNKAGFTNLHNYDPLSVDLIENSQSYGLPPGASINRFGIFFHLCERLVAVTERLGPFYNARALKLDKMIPKAVWAIKQMIPILNDEINKVVASLQRAGKGGK